MHFCQRDEPWADIRLGFGTTTVGAEGCLLCASADMLTDAGEDTDPGRLNRWLARNGGFVDNRFVFASVDALGSVHLLEVVNCVSSPAPMDRVEETLELGGFVLAMVDFRPVSGAVDQHWVRLLEVGADDCLISDPWLMVPTYSLMARYARPTWSDPARALMGLALYGQGQRARGVQAKWTKPGPVQERDPFGV